jgi:hypothetical protein
MPDNKPEANIDPTEAKRRADEWREIKMLAGVLMAGLVEEIREGRPTSRYLEPDSQEERDARKAMARLLRSGLPLEQDFLNRLAALFDPERSAHLAIDRELKFKPRKRKGEARDNIRDSAIAMEVYEFVLGLENKPKVTVSEAWDRVADKFDLDSNRIKQIWIAKRKPILCDYIHGRLLAGDDEAKALEKANQHFGAKNDLTKKEPIQKIWNDYKKSWELLEGCRWPWITG